jgi:hypothetical protein
VSGENYPQGWLVVEMDHPEKGFANHLSALENYPLGSGI